MRLTGMLLLVVGVSLLVGALASFRPLYNQLTGSSSPLPTEMGDAFLLHAICTSACLGIGILAGLVGCVLLTVGYTGSRRRNSTPDTSPRAGQ